MFLVGVLAVVWTRLFGDTLIAAPGRGPAATNHRKNLDQAKLVSQFEALPLRFEPNRGQTDARVKFLSRMGAHALFLTSGGAVLRLNSPGGEPTSGSVLRFTWVGANRHARIRGVDELPGKSNYLIGRVPAGWRTNVSSYGRVRYEDIYPGIDLLYYGDGGRLEYDLVLAPGARPDVIRLKLDGAERVSLDRDGDLIVSVRDAQLRLLKPLVYQNVAGARKRVDARYAIAPNGEVRFSVGAYDRSQPLVVDPQLTYSSYLGGSASDSGWRVAVDAAGLAYLTGWSRSADFPLASPLQGAKAAPMAAVVIKINPELPGASSLIYSTYLGGTGNTVGRDIAVNGSGRIFVGGDTSAPDFPVTAGAYQTACKVSGAQCSSDVFATMLDPTGTSVLYSTYLGGAGSEYGFGLTIDGSDHIFLTGPTGSADFPTTAGAFQRSFSGGGGEFGDAFVAELNPAGGGTNDLLYSTYLGGGGSETSWTIAVDGSQDIYVAGNTASTNFPTTGNAYSRTYSGTGTNDQLGDAFVAKLRPVGGGQADLLYSTYLGGSAEDRAESIVLDASNTVYVTGFTTSSNFPVTTNAYQTIFGGGTCLGGPCADAFVARLDPSSAGTASLWYSTFFGGSSFDLAHAIALDSAGFVYVAGETESTDLPLRNPIQSACFGGCTPLPMVDVLVAKFDLSQPGQAGLLFSTYLGGGDVDTAWGLAVDDRGNAYVTGQVFSSNYPTLIPFQPICNNCTSFTAPAPSGDAFLTRICTINCPAAGVFPASLSFGSQSVGTSGTAQNITLSNPGTGNLTIAGISITGIAGADFSQSHNCPVVLSPQGSCTISVSFTPTATGTRTAAVTITSNASGSPQLVSLSGTGTAPPPPAPWPNGYSYQATFAVKAGQVPSAQSNFPVLIAGTFADFRTVVNAGRVVNITTQPVGPTVLTVPSDLIFTADAAGTTLLSWEFESYTPATGAVTIWVKAPTLASGTVVYAWYGNAAVTTLQTTASATWSSTFLAVYHLKDDPTGAAPQVTDSTAGAHQGTLNGTIGSSQQQPGQIAGSFDFSTAKAWAALANPADFSFERTDPFSLAAWVKTTSNTSGTLLSKLDATSTTGWGLFQYGTATTPRFSLGLQGNGGANNYAMVATNAISSGVWHYVVATYSGTSTVAGMKIYVDGVSQPLTTLSDTLTVSIVNAQTPALNGRGGSTNMSSDGLDEVRVSAKGVVLAPDWITTSYTNQSSPATFFTVITGLTTSGGS